MNQAPHLFVFTDGASRGNPGEAGIGVVIKNEQGLVRQTISEYLGIATNNVAEYTALIRALEVVTTWKPGAVDFHLDSQLVVMQMTGRYKIRDQNMLRLANRANVLCKELGSVVIQFHYIPRALNTEADAMANAGIDNKNRKG